MSADLLAQIAMMRSQLEGLARSVANVQDDIPGVGDMLPQKFLHEGAAGALAGIPQFGIILWWKPTIPAGWALCDGTNGTPDWRDKFIVGSGSTYTTGDTGGAATHSHAVNETIPKNHSHGSTEVQSGSGTTVMAYHDKCDDIPDNADYCGDSSPGDTHWTMTTNNASSLPPYYAAAYIMKL